RRRTKTSIHGLSRNREESLCAGLQAGHLFVIIGNLLIGSMRRRWQPFNGNAWVVEWLKAPGCKPGRRKPYVGSNPTPCTTSGSSSVGRASAFQAECREFESRLPLHYVLRLAQVAQG